MDALKPTILIIDDDANDRYLLTHTLLETGRVGKLIEADDGLTGLQLFEDFEPSEGSTNRFPPLLIFLDINMPVMDGHQFLARFDEIREMKNCVSTVVTMFSTSQRGEDRTRALAYEFVSGFITKGDETPEMITREIDAAIAASAH